MWMVDVGFEVDERSREPVRVNEHLGDSDAVSGFKGTGPEAAARASGSGSDSLSESMSSKGGSSFDVGATGRTRARTEVIADGGRREGMRGRGIGAVGRSWSVQLSLES